MSRSIPISRNRPYALAFYGKEPDWRDRSQGSILRNVTCPLASTLREAAFGECLQPPRNRPEQMFAMPRVRFFREYLPIFVAQSRQAAPAQALNLHQNCIVHVPV